MKENVMNQNKVRENDYRRRDQYTTLDLQVCNRPTPLRSKPLFQQPHLSLVLRSRKKFARLRGYPFQVDADRTRENNKAVVITSNTTVTTNNPLEAVKASRCSSIKPGIDTKSKAGSVVPILRYPSMKALAAEVMKSSTFLLMDEISKGAMSSAMFQSIELLGINISAAILLTKLITSRTSSSTSASWNAFEKIRFAAVEGKLPSGGCPEDVILTVPSFPRRTWPPDILGCASHKRTLARGPTRRISDDLVTPTPCSM